LLNFNNSVSILWSTPLIAHVLKIPNVTKKVPMETITLTRFASSSSSLTRVIMIMRIPHTIVAGTKP